MKILALAVLVPLAVSHAAAPTPANPAGAPTSAVLAPDPGAAPAAQAPTAKVGLVSAPGKSAKGELTLENEGLAVHLRGEITGLVPGQQHGFHVHEVGQCTPPDFASAGAHFNPAKDPHGGPDTNARHLGDLGNVKADDTGRARVDVMVKGATVVDKDGGPNQLVGKALVVHAMPDDYKTQPSGGSGDRIACGVIQSVGPTAPPRG